ARCAAATSAPARSAAAAPPDDRRTRARGAGLAGVGPPASAGWRPRAELAPAAAPDQRGGAAAGPTTYLFSTHRVTLLRSPHPTPLTDRRRSTCPPTTGSGRTSYCRTRW